MDGGMNIITEAGGCTMSENDAYHLHWHPAKRIAALIHMSRYTRSKLTFQMNEWIR